MAKKVPPKISSLILFIVFLSFPGTSSPQSTTPGQSEILYFSPLPPLPVCTYPCLPPPIPTNNCPPPPASPELPQPPPFPVPLPPGTLPPWVFAAPPPPNPILPYFPWYYKYPPPPPDFSSAMCLRRTMVMLSCIVLSVLFSLSL
ncbi:hypothetical protein SLEP1_g54034 [Rubroshorea leprosula]|uniref:Uncharacterized protein n=1 Tax=Rubroshorea leprosula TaxID=152421 RepID=A0AAV5MDL8_9ROSI|nr:hypothetical protein SLEP1_g54034 [Rubroshorea leprosula]